ncbi:MAG: HD domain-containing protein [Prevotella sp.]|nr:HD domain-containing protein [Prevotella sp.]
MIDQNVSLDLMQFVETNILPKYNDFGKSHGLAHVQSVIKNSLELARKIGADPNMAYAIAAYHDIGMSGPRAIHHITGGKIMASDLRLKRWFSDDQLRVMREAIEDHRASAAHAPRSIYGKIVAEADRELSPESVFRRTVQFGLEHYPEKSREEHWERFSEHMQNKYSTNGYITLWIPNSPNEKSLKLIRDIIAQPQLLRQEFEKYYDEETAKASTHNDNNPT